MCNDNDQQWKWVDKLIMMIYLVASAGGGSAAIGRGDFRENLSFTEKALELKIWLLKYS